MSLENVPALSIRQPWAQLIVQGRKSIEIRSGTPAYRGLIWIHTGKKEQPELEAHFGFTHLFKGGYIGAVELKTIVPLNRERWDTWRLRHLDTGLFQPNLFAWILASPLRFAIPVPGPGKLGLFSVPLEARQGLFAAYSAIKGRGQNPVSNLSV